jgi:hypothetical protein
MARQWVFAPLLHCCVACVPGQQAEGPQPAAPSRTPYATQIDAPAPEYGGLIADSPIPLKGRLRRDAVAPLPTDAKAVGNTWIDRLQTAGVLDGYGLAGEGTDGPVSWIDVAMTASAFDDWVARNSWNAPDWIRWGFQPELLAPPVSAAAQAGIRTWPSSQRRTGVQLLASLGGRVTLRDGCFHVLSPDRPETLAWFHAETGLDVDPEGYYILVNRMTGETMARVGEDMSWAGPNVVPADDPGLAALQAACGPGTVTSVGNPESSERMATRYPHLRERKAVRR